jgi:hypothetical protein
MRPRIRALWPNLATLYDHAEGSAEAKDPRGYRWDDVVRDLILKAQVVPKRIWNEFFVGFG